MFTRLAYSYSWSPSKYRREIKRPEHKEHKHPVAQLSCYAILFNVSVISSESFINFVIIPSDTLPVFVIIHFTITAIVCKFYNAIKGL